MHRGWTDRRREKGMIQGMITPQERWVETIELQHNILGATEERK